MLRAQLTIASDADWSKFDLATAVSHELGHFFGLPDVDHQGMLMHWELLERTERQVTNLDAALARDTYDDECVGCSVGHGADGWGVAVVMVVAVMMRRRKTC